MTLNKLCQTQSRCDVPVAQFLFRPGWPQTDFSLGSQPALILSSWTSSVFARESVESLRCRSTPVRQDVMDCAGSGMCDKAADSIVEFGHWPPPLGAPSPPRYLQPLRHSPLWSLGSKRRSPLCLRAFQIQKPLTHAGDPPAQLRPQYLPLAFLLLHSGDFLLAESFCCLFPIPRFLCVICPSTWISNWVGWGCSVPPNPSTELGTGMTSDDWLADGRNKWTAFCLDLHLHVGHHVSSAARYQRRETMLGLSTSVKPSKGACHTKPDSSRGPRVL